MKPLKKLAGLSFPRVIIVILLSASEGSSATVAATITAWGVLWHRERYSPA
jgi:hypothetical protein